MSAFLAKPLNEMFRPTPNPLKGVKTWVVAYDADGEAGIVKGRNRLWSVTLNGHTYINSRLSDLIEQVERIGFTVERRGQ